MLRDSGLQQKKDVGWLGSEQRWTVSHIATSVELIRKNLGVAWLPRHAVQPFLDNGELLPLLLPRGANRTYTFYLNFNDADTLGPVARSFLGHLRYLCADESFSS